MIEILECPVHVVVCSPAADERGECGRDCWHDMGSDMRGIVVGIWWEYVGYCYRYNIRPSSIKVVGRGIVAGGWVQG